MNRRRVLVCDDDDMLRLSLGALLEDEGYEVARAVNGERALDAAFSKTPDAILLDLYMPVMDGLTCLRKLREAGSRVPVIVMTAHGGVDSAIEATRLGAAAWVQKPFDTRELLLHLEHALTADRLAKEVGYLRERQRAEYGDIVGDSPAMHEVFATLRRLEGINAPTVLVTGESGTGKELIAQAVHNHGPRKDEPFVEIDCASLPETLIESELFGHERGAFTDARQQKRGLFEVARSGTIFLDEIGEMPLGTQAKLLRALETRKMKRVGGVVDIAIDAGIVAATNRDLAKEAEAGRFRSDLYYRLAVIPIALPPLRARPGDIPALVSHFLDVFRRRFTGRLEGLGPLTLEAMVAYPWPGNVRELKNVMERMVALYRDELWLELDHLPPEVRYAKRPSAITVAAGSHRFALPPEGVDLESVEQAFVVQALDRARWNQTNACKLLGISRYALKNRIDKFGLKAP